MYVLIGSLILHFLFSLVLQILKIYYKIRGIFNLTENKPYKGPMVSAMKLFSGTNAFNNSIQTRIVEHKFDYQEPKQSQEKDWEKLPKKLALTN